ncbi:MAG TPA: histidine kinase [Sporichthya sp.]|nr:histidine kinase [Sporichthya sp.]
MTDEPAAPLRDALRGLLNDPTLDIVFCRVGSNEWVDPVGQPTATTGVAGRAVTPIERDGAPIAALVHDPALLGRTGELQLAAAEVSAAIDSEQIKAELRAQLLDLQASRARIVEAVDSERRRMERNLHDGAQQRLVGLALTLRLAGREAAENPVLTELLTDAQAELDDALAELRRLARGLHPAIVIDAGLRVALETLAERPGLPVDLSVDLPGRLPDHAEIAAYYVVAEALANTNKHAGASRVSARAQIEGDLVRVSVADNGCGGAVPAPGSGLQGLADRVSALGGSLTVESPAGQGTTVTADIPLHLPRDLDRGRRARVALKWIGWQNWLAPAVLYDQITDEDLLNGGKAILLGAGGNSALTPAERNWLVSYLTAAGESERVVEALAAYDDSDRLADIMGRPGMAYTGRGLLYDSVRVCAADGPPTPVELERLAQAADAMSVPRHVLDELVEIVLAEHALQRRRYELIVLPVLPVTLLAPGPDDRVTPCA